MSKAQPRTASILKVTDRDGRLHELEAIEGWRVMEILRDYKVGIEGICGGSLDCASCHVVVDAKWAGRLYPPREDEIDKLDELPLIEETSRLSCQILWSDTLDGLHLTIPEAV